MTPVTKKLVAIGLVVAAAGVLIGFYITGFLMSGPPTFTPNASAGRKT